MKFCSIVFYAKGTADTATGGDGASAPVENMREKAVVFDFTTNSFVGVLQLEGSMDGMIWFNIGSTVNADLTVVTITYAVKYLRIHTTTATSGGIAIATCGGMDSRAS